MKNRIMITALAVLLFSILPIIINAQIEVIEGPEVNNATNTFVNRIIQGDSNNFFTYRLKTKGKGLSCFVEKYEKESMKFLFSKEIKMEQNQYINIENVQYAAGNIFIFISIYDNDKDIMTLSYRTISSLGEVSAENIELMNIKSDDNELIDFDIFQTPDNLKSLVKVSHCATEKDDYNTDFILYDSKNMKQLFSKRVSKNLSGKMYKRTTASSKVPAKSPLFYELIMDNDENIYYSYLDKIGEGDKQYELFLDVLFSKENTPHRVQLDFDKKYQIEDIKLIKNEKKEIVLGGFLKDHENHTGFDLLRAGLACFTVTLENLSVKSSEMLLFDDNILISLDVSARTSQFHHYKMDYIYQIEGNTFFVGEQYVRCLMSSGPANTVSYTGNADSPVATDSDPAYQYKDVFIAKFNTNYKWDWVKNIPLRIEFKQKDPHYSSQYIAYATNKNIYILNNDSKGNIKLFEKPKLDVRALRYSTKARGSNFVCREISLNDGSIKHKLVFKNENYCFDPTPSFSDFTGPFPPYSERKYYYPSSDTHVFVTGAKNEIYIKTENSLKSRFLKLHFN